MSAQIRLPGRVAPLVIEPPQWAHGHAPAQSRTVYAAAHVAARPDGSIDWASTQRFRDHLWDHGFGIADAMDTAQRGMGLSWPQTRELILRSGHRARERGAVLACGAGTDQLDDGDRHRLTSIAAAYAEQLAFVEEAGARPILMASRALAESGAEPAEYVALYSDLLDAAEQPVVLHWLGEAFDARLRGYWGCDDLAAATEVVLEVIAHAPGRVDGVKVSLLDPHHELALRERLPAGVRLYTGDDFHFASLVKGDATGHSDALLGAFAAMAAPAAHALAALDRGDLTTYDEVMGRCETLARTIFEAPTSAYKVGVAFVAWLNGFQPTFSMLGGLESRRSLEHLERVFELAAAAGALLDPDLAVERMTPLLADRTARPPTEPAASAAR